MGVVQPSSKASHLLVFRPVIPPMPDTQNTPFSQNHFLTLRRLFLTTLFDGKGLLTFLDDEEGLVESLYTLTHSFWTEIVGLGVGYRRNFSCLYILLNDCFLLARIERAGGLLCIIISLSSSYSFAGSKSSYPSAAIAGATSSLALAACYRLQLLDED